MPERGRSPAALMSRRGLTSALRRAGRTGLNSYKCRFVPLENGAAQTRAAAVREKRCVQDGNTCKWKRTGCAGWLGWGRGFLIGTSVSVKIRWVLLLQGA